MHGPHQVAQKLITKVLSLLMYKSFSNSSKDTVVTSVISVAGISFLISGLQE